jgi:ribonuclease H2 subunit B
MSELRNACFFAMCRPIFGSFSPLDSYLLQQMQEQAPLKSATNTGKKGAATKPETEKKRKAKGSHGVEQLKKANTTGMSKLSSFFNKAEKAKG